MPTDAPDAPKGPTGPPAIWGILNVTPDSFSDGGLYDAPDLAVARGLGLVADGADVLDVGGESTRPGARPVDANEERARVVPVIRGLKEAGVVVPISVDTQKSVVADAALEAGASIVNDISAGTHDSAMLGLVAAQAAGLVVMHMRGTPRTMQDEPRYTDVVGEIRVWLASRVEAATAAGVDPGRLWVDPGLGFGKTLAHNLAILQNLEALVGDGTPVLLGASRKSFLGLLTGREVDERVSASLACVARAADAGVAAVRVHDVAASTDVVRTWGRIRRS